MVDMGVTALDQNKDKNKDKKQDKDKDKMWQKTSTWSSK